MPFQFAIEPTATWLLLFFLTAAVLYLNVSFLNSFLLNKSTGYIIFCRYFRRVGKYLCRFIVFNQLPHIKIGCFVAYTSSLLHIMSNDNDRKVVLQIMD